MRSLLLDTNLLCLLVVGQVGEDRIARHKRLNRYDVGDYRQLIDILSTFDRLIVTPHVLAECSNLIRLAPEPLRTEATQRLATLIPEMEERHREAITTVSSVFYVMLGLTDAALVELVADGLVMLTDDLDLYLATLRRGGTAINYNHLREGMTLAGLGLA